MGTYRRRGHWRRGTNGSLHWVSAHSVTRDRRGRYPTSQLDGRRAPAPCNDASAAKRLSKLRNRPISTPPVRWKHPLDEPNSRCPVKSQELVPSAHCAEHRYRSLRCRLFLFAAPADTGRGELDEAVRAGCEGALGHPVTHSSVGSVRPARRRREGRPVGHPSSFMARSRRIDEGGRELTGHFIQVDDSHHQVLLGIPPCDPQRGRLRIACSDPDDVT